MQRAHDWQPDGGKVIWESHPGGEALHVHTTCSKCGARAWFVEYQWELLTKDCNDAKRRKNTLAGLNRDISAGTSHSEPDGSATKPAISRSEDGASQSAAPISYAAPQVAGSTPASDDSEVTVRDAAHTTDVKMAVGTPAVAAPKRRKRA